MENEPKKIVEKLRKRNDRLGIITNIETLYRILLNKISAKNHGSPIDNEVIYLNSKAYRNLRIKMEIRKARALEEAYRNRPR